MWHEKAFVDELIWNYDGERRQSWDEPCQEWYDANLDQQLRRKKDEESYTVQVRDLAQYHLDEIGYG